MDINTDVTKEWAIRMLGALNIYKPYIDDFKSKDKVCMFEEFGGFYIYQYPELAEKVRAIEDAYNIKVYAITHEFSKFGELYDFLYVSNKKSEWKEPFWEDNVAYVFAYVWNKSDNFCSEFGEIGVACFGGGIKRIY